MAMDEKLELSHSAASSIKNDPKVFAAFGALGFAAEDKYFASSEGSSIQQLIVRSYPDAASLRRRHEERHLAKSQL